MQRLSPKRKYSLAHLIHITYPKSLFSQLMQFSGHFRHLFKESSFLNVLGQSGKHNPVPEVRVRR